MDWEKTAGMQKMARFCAYQERCRQELEQKLEKLGCPAAEQEEVLAELAALGFWDEERFARSYARGKFRQLGWGKVKIRQALHFKGVEGSLVATALEEEIPEELYRERLQQELEKRSRGRDLDDPGEWQKVFGALVNRGYEQGLVVAAMKGEF